MTGFPIHCRYVLESQHMKKFFDYIQLPNFDIAADAAATFKVKRFLFSCFPFHLTLGALISFFLLMFFYTESLHDKDKQME